MVSRNVPKGSWAKSGLGHNTLTSKSKTVRTELQIERHRAMIILASLPQAWRFQDRWTNPSRVTSVLRYKGDEAKRQRVTRLSPANASRTGWNFGATALKVPLTAVFAFVVRFIGPPFLFGTVSLASGLTPAVSRARKRARSGRWRASAPLRGSA